MNKDWFYVMPQSNSCLNGEVNPCPLLYVLFSTWIYITKLIHLFDAWVQCVDVIFYYLRKKSKQKIQSVYQYTTTSCFFKIYIDNSSEYEDKSIDIMRGYAIPSGMPWHLADDVYGTVNSNPKFHCVLVVVALKERCIKVYDSMSSNRSNRKLSSEIQKMATMLPKYLELSEFFEQNERNN